MPWVQLLLTIGYRRTATQAALPSLLERLKRVEQHCETWFGGARPQSSENRLVDNRIDTLYHHIHAHDGARNAGSLSGEETIAQHERAPAADASHILTPTFSDVSSPHPTPTSEPVTLATSILSLTEFESPRHALSEVRRLVIRRTKDTMTQSKDLTVPKELSVLWIERKQRLDSFPISSCCSRSHGIIC